MLLNACACSFPCATVVGCMHIIKLIIPLLLMRELNALHFSVLLPLVCRHTFQIERNKKYCMCCQCSWGFNCGMWCWVRNFQCLPVPSRVKQAKKARHSLLNLLQMGLSVCLYIKCEYYFNE